MSAVAELSLLDRNAVEAETARLARAYAATAKPTTRVRVLAPFIAAPGRDAEPGEVIEVPRFDAADLESRGLAERIEST